MRRRTNSDQPLASVLPRCCVALACVALGLVDHAPAWAQGFARPPVMRRAFIRPGRMPPSATGESGDKYAEGALLKTDPESQQLLKRADQFVQEKRYDLAAVLWQKVLDDAGDSLITDNGELFISLRQLVEKRLATVSPEALRAYRLTADGDAQGLWSAAPPEQEEKALSEVVRRYFLSSHGDDAAYRLGCLALDRHDFVMASRLFAKIIEEHPDPSIARGDILLRLAIALGRSGDQAGGEKALEELKSVESGGPRRTLIAQVTADVAKAGGDRRRQASFAVAPAIPADETAKTLSSAWSYEFPLSYTERNMFNPYMGYSNNATPERSQVARENLVEQWKQNGWNPAGKIVFEGDRVFLKTNEDLKFWNRRQLEKGIQWSTLWKNEFEVDEYSSIMSAYARMSGMRGGGASEGGGPRGAAEIHLFGDRVHQDFSIIGGMVYNIEGRRIARLGPTEVTARPEKRFDWNTVPRRTRVNWLSAYDATTGKIKWNRPADDDGKENEAGGMGFLAAPVACGSLLLAPVTDGGTIWLHGLSPETGKTQWKTYLCDEPPGGCNPWSPVSVAVEGREAYVLCGAGVIFSLDGTTGSIRWVLRYPRDERPQSSVVNNVYGNNLRVRKFSGWHEDRILSFGRSLIVMAADSDRLFALDRRTGEMLWDSPRTSPNGSEAEYCLGMKEGSLFVAGARVARRYDLNSGLLRWEREFETSYGRGVLTEDSIYLPVKDSVLRLEPQWGKELAQVGVHVSTNDPVGNLFTDGEHLWMLSANRISLLTHLDARLKQLDSRIEQGDVESLWERLRLFAKTNRWDDVRRDFRAGHQLLLTTEKSASVAALRTLTVIEELKLPTREPEFTLSLLHELFSKELATLGSETRSRLEGDVHGSLLSLLRDRPQASATPILATLPLFTSQSLRDTASRALKKLATNEQASALLTAAGQGETAAAVVIEALTQRSPREAKPVAEKLATSSDPYCQLAAARALVQGGEPSGVALLIRLLGARDLNVRTRSGQTLRNATGQSLAFTSYAPEAERTAQINAWQAWFDGQQGKLELKLPLPETEVLLGRTLVCLPQKNRILEFDADMKEMSQHTLVQPWSVLGLPNGNRLVAQPQQSKLVEYDDKWKPVATIDNLPAGVYGVDRTLDGVTIAVCSDVMQVIEISALGEKKVLWRSQGDARPTSARRLENGNTLLCLQIRNRVIEIDGTGKTVWEASAANPASAQRLENGSTLVASSVNSMAGQIVEFDATGKRVKVVKEGIRQLSSAFRLSSGNTLYSDADGLHEIDPSGSEVWNRKERFVSGFSRF